MKYKYGQKNQWRRWMWNRVAERTKDRREKKVLYLAGPDAYDIGAASLRGFDTRNMIAVEREQNALRSLRAAGLLAIDGELCDVMEAWPQECSVGVVVADFCCGMEANIVNRIARQSAHFWPFVDATFCFNFLRGRDASSSSDREMFSGEWDRIENPLHRGEMFFQLYVGSIVANSFSAQKEFDGDWNNPSHKIESAFDVVTRLAKPVFYSYRSTAGNQYFDSVVFKNIIADSFLITGSEACKPKKQIVSTDLIPQRRRTAAVLAHNTRRLAA